MRNKLSGLTLRKKHHEAWLNVLLYNFISDSFKKKKKKNIERKYSVINYLSSYDLFIYYIHCFNIKKN